MGGSCGCEGDEHIPDADAEQEERKVLQLKKVLVETAKLLDADGDGFISRAELDRLDSILSGSSHDGAWEHTLRSCKCKCDRAANGKLSCRDFVCIWLADGCQLEHCETVLKALRKSAMLIQGAESLAKSIKSAHPTTVHQQSSTTKRDQLATPVTSARAILSPGSQLFSKSRGNCACCHQPVLESQHRLKLDTCSTSGGIRSGYIHRESNEQANTLESTIDESWFRNIPHATSTSAAANRGSCLACGQTVLVTQQRVKSRRGYMHQKCHVLGLQRAQAQSPVMDPITPEASYSCDQANSPILSDCVESNR